ncbi:MAG: FAD-dependent oxidoreductase, partial [Lawsonibacter sp.]|nr:FAD-dependent oxidoreductase [Lawsonibacter sp.]
MVYDMIVLGSGPAGLAAAIAARGRNKSALVIGNRWQDSPLAKAERVDNYPGLPGRTGLEVLEALHSHAEAAGAEFVVGKALSLLAWDGFSVTVGSQVYQGKALILAPGVVRQSKYPGEAEYLGRGVSYCATCDGMLYRGKKVAVLGWTPSAEKEAAFLQGIGCEVLYFDKPRD